VGRRTQAVRRVLAVLGINGLLLGIACASEAPRILEHAPSSPDPTARYLFCLHGRIIEVQGPDAVSPDFGRYEHHRIILAGGSADPDWAARQGSRVRGHFLSLLDHSDVIPGC
jgi:hypothetical protein